MNTTLLLCILFLLFCEFVVATFVPGYLPHADVSAKICMGNEEKKKDHIQKIYGKGHSSPVINIISFTDQRFKKIFLSQYYKVQN